MRSKSNNKWRFIYKLHRYIGLSNAVILIMLAVTGIALNHTEFLKLDSKMIQSKTILDWYGVEQPEKLTSFHGRQHWLTQVNQQIYFDQTLLIENQGNLVGVVENEEYIVVAMNGLLLLLTLEGDLIEQIALMAVEKIGFDSNQLSNIYVISDKQLLLSDDGLVSWQADTTSDRNKIEWSEKNDLPETIAQQIKSDFSSSVLPWERVMLDLHSGRIFGTFGVIIVDLSGVFLIILSLSGCAIWLKHKLRHFRRR